jgi:hypothetical protein
MMRTGDWNYVHIKLQLVQDVKPHDKPQRVNSVMFKLQQLTAEDSYLQKALFSD